MNEEKFMVKQTIEFSDGTKSVLDYSKNSDAEEIESKVAKAVAGDHRVSRDVFEETEISVEPVIPEVEIEEKIEIPEEIVEEKVHKGKKK